MIDHSLLCSTIIIFLNAAGNFAWKNQTGVVRKSGCWIQYGYPGSPDILCVMKGGQFLGVEVKIGKDKQRDKQKLFEDIVKKIGGHYLLVKTFDQFNELYQAILSRGTASATPE